jgi:UDPglucose--hexose-1-phosphate uridylyltransferase
MTGTERALRPGGQPLAWRAAADRPQARRFDPQCPFCPGHENQLPGIVAETRAHAPPHWSVRVVPNKYPALTPDVDVAPDRPREARDGYGFHEVIIENPRHDADLASMTEAEVEAVVVAYRDRASELLYRPGIEAVVLFRNHGARAGASLPHPHAQVVAIGMVPPMTALSEAWGVHYHAEHGRCPTCDEIAGARHSNVRLVEQTENFVALVPYAAEYPCETWILPVHHQPWFVDIDEAASKDFARLLRRTLLRLRLVHDDPPYSFVIDAADWRHRLSPFLHWRLRIAPKLASWGGFELGAGMAINPSIPEHDATMLRAATVDDEASHEDHHFRG